MKKKCSKCGILQELNCFSKNKTRKDGLQGFCKTCQANYRYLQRNKQYFIKYHKTHYNTLLGRLRSCWGHINQRVTNPKVWNYKNYGGRGIKNLFESFDSFYNHIVYYLGYNTYEGIANLQIDRIDNNGNYVEDNIRFVTAKENGNNKRNNVV